MRGPLSLGWDQDSPGRRSRRHCVSSIMTWRNPARVCGTPASTDGWVGVAEGGVGAGATDADHGRAPGRDAACTRSRPANAAITVATATSTTTISTVRTPPGRLSG